jgi:hypothetical protein
MDRIRVIEAARKAAKNDVPNPCQTDYYQHIPRKRSQNRGHPAFFG